ncbi:hypothetical protein W01_23070 [Candidatus Nitrotoga sp. AM1P]|nr:hypothetical protein W01_23070 [Candidatus Nitrotoga sp. AM1P]
MVFAAWFTYGSTGQPEWLVMSSCPVVENACMGDIYKVVGGTKLGVPWNGAGKVVTKVGVGTLIFADNNTGTLNYSVDGVSGTKQITRQIFESGSSQPAIDYSALWWNENESGWGVAITQQYGMIFAVMYTYDTSGNPVWYVASGCPLSGDNCTGDLYKVTGGSEPNVTWNGANKVVAKVGTVSFVFNDSSTGVMSYVINGVSGSKAISRQLFGEAVAATYQSAYDACYIGTPLLYTSNYCAAYANAIVAGSTPLVANQAGAVAAGSNVGNIGMGGAITATGTPYVPNAGPTPTPRLAFNLTSLTFSPQENFTTSAIQTVILSNVGNTGILLHSNITLPLFARWNIVNDTCIYAPSIFMAGASCTVSISFTPRGDDNIRNVYLLRKSLGENPSLPTSENYSGIFEVYGDSVTNPQVVVPKQAVQLNGTGVYPPDATPAPTVNGIAAFSGTYNIKTSDGTVATFTVDSNGNVSSCKVDSVVVCSGKLTLSLSTGEANFQIIGNDGLNPIDTTASFSGTINKNGDVSGGYLGNSVSEGGFSGTFTGSKAGGGAVTSECGVLGQIIEIRQSGPNMVNIPLVCRENRIDNWVSAPPEAGLSTQEICDRATTPTDELTGRPVPITKIKNMSACFCLIDGNFASGKQTKCWTYYDLAK